MLHVTYSRLPGEKSLSLRAEFGGQPEDIADLRHAIVVRNSTSKVVIPRWDYSLAFLNRWGTDTIASTTGGMNMAGGRATPDNILPFGKTTLDICVSYHNLQNGIYYRQSWTSVADSSARGDADFDLALQPIDNVVAERGPTPLPCDGPSPPTFGTRGDTGPGETRFAARSDAPARWDGQITDQSTQTTANTRWSYGRHPVLGLSAHVSIGDEAIGFSCIEGDGGWTLSHRMTPGLVARATPPDTFVAEVFLEPFIMGGGSKFERHSNGFLERQSNYCASGIDHYLRSKSALLVDADDFAVSFEGRRTTGMEIEQNRQRLTLSREEDVGRIARTVAVPLTGSSAALNQLIRSCRKLRREITDGCDHR